MAKFLLQDCLLVSWKELFHWRLEKKSINRLTGTPLPPSSLEQRSSPNAWKENKQKVLLTLDIIEMGVTIMMIIGGNELDKFELID